jgi:uncharacterized membrane protein YgaE (UPF0421/DUF939 family)
MPDRSRCTATRISIRFAGIQRVEFAHRLAIEALPLIGFRSKATWSGAQLALRAAIAGGFAVAIARYFSFDYPIFAFIAAVLVTDLSASESRKLGWLRLIATLVGAFWGALLAPLIPSGAVAVAFSVLVAMITCQVFAGAGGARVAAFICGIIVLDNPSQPWMYAFHRLAETALGVAVAWAVSFVPKLFQFEDDRKDGADLG